MGKKGREDGRSLVACNNGRCSVSIQEKITPTVWFIEHDLGEVLRGDHIENSPFVFRMREQELCHVVCRMTLDAKTAKEFKDKIQDEYRVNMILDNLPLVVPIQRLVKEAPLVYQLGFHVGLKGQYAGETYQVDITYNQHLDLDII